MHNCIRAYEAGSRVTGHAAARSGWSACRKTSLAAAARNNCQWRGDWVSERGPESAGAQRTSSETFRVRLHDTRVAVAGLTVHVRRHKVNGRHEDRTAGRTITVRHGGGGRRTERIAQARRAFEMGVETCGYGIRRCKAAVGEWPRTCVVWAQSTAEAVERCQMQWCRRGPLSRAWGAERSSMFMLITLYTDSHITHSRKRNEPGDGPRTAYAINKTNI